MNIKYHNQIITGDALDLLAELPDGELDSVVTDPPFKLSQTYNTAVDADNLMAVSSIWIVAQQLYRVTRCGGLAAIFYDNRILPVGLRAFQHAGWCYLRNLTLYRRWGQASKVYGWMSTSDFVLIFAKPGAPYQFHGDTYHDVYTKVGPERESTGHPAQKPLDFVSAIVANITPPDGIVIDPYAGSGTTAMAAKQNSRNYICFELDANIAADARERVAGTQRMPITMQSELAL